MKFTESILGKPLDQLSVEDVEGFFLQPQEESDRIEFKSYHADLKSKKTPEERLADVLKTITAFLNSGGGFIVWGAPVETIQKYCQGALTPFDVKYTKDQFIGRIADSIVPSPQGVFFRSFEKEGKYFYIIEAESSSYAPHQYRNVYYMRMDGHTKAAPHHYIEALFKKVSFPNLEAYLKLDRYIHTDGDMARLYCTIIFRNQSPFQNDYNLQYRVFTSHGLIMPGAAMQVNLTKEKLAEQGDYSNPEVANTIYYGNWLHDSFNISLSRTNLHNNEYIIKIRLQFGAKHSPMKLCQYTINIGERVNDNLQDHIIDMVENRFFNIHELEMMKPDKERLFETLGRRTIQQL
jgi:hypothetical protein